MKKHNFTLIEMLIVVGIIGILAGMVLGGIAVAQQRGRITQARADMTSLRTAFEGMYRDYGRMVASGNKLGGNSFTASDGCITIAEASATNTYCNVIAELSAPDKITPSLNKRRIKYLDPRPEYDPSQGPTDGDNKEHTWLDPWDNPYRMRINVDATEQIPDPSDSSSSPKKLAGRIVLWSIGPDGEDGSDAKDKDNIAGWKDGDWKD